MTDISSTWGRLITAMVTPFNEHGNIDEGAVRSVIEHLLETGTDSLVVCGTTGEAPTLSDAEKRRMFELAKSVAGSRARIIASTGTYDTAHTIELSRDAASLGADGLLLITPYYNRPSQDGLYRHFRTVADAVDLPIMLYNVPARTGVNIEAWNVARLFRDAANIVAVKEASGNLMQVSDIVASAPKGQHVYSGDDGLLLPIMAVGGTGIVSVTSHLVGADMKAMIAAHIEGNPSKAAQIHARMLPIVRACFQPTTPSPAPLKAALALLGFCTPKLRLPLVEANQRETDIVRTALRDYGLIA